MTDTTGLVVVIRHFRNPVYWYPLGRCLQSGDDTTQFSIGLVLTEVDYDFVEQVSVVVFNDPPGGDHLFDLFVVELAVFAEHIVRDLLAARRFDEDDERLQILFPHDGNGRRVHHTNGDASARHHRSDRVDRRPVQILLIFSFFHKLRGLFKLFKVFFGDEVIVLSVDFGVFDGSTGVSDWDAKEMLLLVRETVTELVPTNVSRSD